MIASEHALLALETTDKTGSIAFCEGGRLVASVDLPAEKRSAQSLVPVVRELLRQVDVPPNAVGAVAVTVGPGSFTGLRIGLATAKMFAYATGATLIGVDTLHTIAAGLTAATEPCRIATAIDAQRGEAVVQTFEIPSDGSIPRPVDAKRRVPLSTWWTEAAKQGAALASPLLAVERVREKIPPGVPLADSAFWFPKAWAAARIAVERLGRGESDDPWTLLPEYARPAAAEEKRDARR